MQYMLLIYNDEKEWARQPEARRGEILGSYMAYTKTMREAGVHVSSAPLQPTAAASTVRVRDDAREVLDGPYADTKEQLGGYYLLDAKDLDEALAWAARCPGAQYGTIEVRPLLELPGDA